MPTQVTIVKGVDCASVFIDALETETRCEWALIKTRTHVGTGTRTLNFVASPLSSSIFLVLGAEGGARSSLQLMQVDTTEGVYVDDGGNGIYAGESIPVLFGGANATDSVLELTYADSQLSITVVSGNPGASYPQNWTLDGSTVQASWVRCIFDEAALAALNITSELITTWNIHAFDGEVLAMGDGCPPSVATIELSDLSVTQLRSTIFWLNGEQYETTRLLSSPFVATSGSIALCTIPASGSDPDTSQDSMKLWVSVSHAGELVIEDGIPLTFAAEVPANSKMIDLGSSIPVAGQISLVYTFDDVDLAPVKRTLEFVPGATVAWVITPEGIDPGAPSSTTMRVYIRALDETPAQVYDITALGLPADIVAERDSNSEWWTEATASPVGVLPYGETRTGKGVFLLDAGPALEPLVVDFPFEAGTTQFSYVVFGDGESPFSRAVKGFVDAVADAFGAALPALRPAVLGALVLAVIAAVMLMRR